MYKKNSDNIKKHKEILRILKQVYRDAKAGLDFENPYQLLVATVLSAQTTDVQVNKVTKNLFPKYPSAKELSLASQEELEQDIKTIGLYKNKSKNLIKTGQVLMEKYNGEIPSSREELMELAGVGRKTANVVLSNAFSIPAIAVDTHVFRVSKRLGLSEGKNPIEVEKDLMSIVPEEDWKDAHHWLIWHGRLVCKSQNPNCLNCPLSEECFFWQNSH